MFRLPPEFSEIISVISPLFSKKVFERAGQLLLGAILTQGKRTVCGVLRTLGLGHIRHWDQYHRVLSRAKWSAYRASQVMLQMLIRHFFKGTSTLVFVIDETLERRWGPQIKARGIYRDAVRSSKSHFVKCSGLRWICVMLVLTAASSLTQLKCHLSTPTANQKCCPMLRQRSSESPPSRPVSLRLIASRCVVIIGVG